MFANEMVLITEPDKKKASQVGLAYYTDFTNLSIYMSPSLCIRLKFNFSIEIRCIKCFDPLLAM